MIKLFRKKYPTSVPPANLISDNFLPPGPLQTAVLFLIFNRPDTTTQVFDAIRKAQPPRLYIASDGPRVEREGEREKVDEARRISTAVDWPCIVNTLFRNKNLGCKYAVSKAITWFFENEEQGIILEDDCLPSQSFFWFCEAMLNEYATQYCVMHVGGYKPATIGCDKYSFTFTRATHIWGWATWRNRWNNYQVDGAAYLKDLEIMKYYEYFISEFKTKKRLKILAKLLSGQIDTWDYQWNLAVRAKGGLGIRPCVNLVKNIGHGHYDATHTFNRRDIEATGNINIEELSMPPWLLPNRELEKQFEAGL